MKRNVFQVMADPARRDVLGLISRQAVSKPIAVLTECGLLRQEKSGREIYDHLNPQKLEEINKWLVRFKQQWEDRCDQLDKLLNHQNSTL